MFLKVRVVLEHQQNALTAAAAVSDRRGLGASAGGVVLACSIPPSNTGDGLCT